MLRAPIGLAVDALGNLYIADFDNQRVRRVSVDGIITTVAGTGQAGSSGDNGPAINARLNAPDYLVFDPAGNLFIAEDFGHRVRKVSPDGMITTVAGGGKPVSGVGDGGPATNASIVWPHGLALDREDNLFIAEAGRERVRRVSPDGTITTVAGTGTQGFSGDGGPARLARLSTPNGLAIDTVGNLYIAESDNHRVRKVSPNSGILTTVGWAPPASQGTTVRPQRPN
jgi:sugar lactone lactonase YvrE